MPRMIVCPPTRHNALFLAFPKLSTSSSKMTSQYLIRDSPMVVELNPKIRP
ncbi:hypothetical protein Sjap_001335 [Stephania japonica]|uniref:Uncharacterized protein n=1 Tax=Stephania japonica TaxID=461633 RepID=A0AAP0KMA7_9MAGN